MNVGCKSTSCDQQQPDGSRPGRRRQLGMALLLAMGFLSLILVMGLSFSYSAVTEGMVAATNADLVSARLLAESGLERVVWFMKKEFAGDSYPGRHFYSPPEWNCWAGRRYLASIGADARDINAGLATNVNGIDFTPAATLHPAVGWIPVSSTRAQGAAQREVLVGRLAYLVIDESGKLDPGVLVSVGDEAEDETPDSGAAHHPRLGASVAEIALADAGVVCADYYRPVSVAGGQAGFMPASGRWFSMGHIAKSLQSVGFTGGDMASLARVAHPFSHDSETFWRDVNGNGTWEIGEEEARVNVAALPSLQELYNLFVGPDKHSPDDDCQWLKQLDNSAWMQTLQASDRLNLSLAQARRLVAAQVAVNIRDYGDGDAVPTRAYLDADGELHEGGAIGAFQVNGVDRTWGLSKLALRLNVEVGHTISGDMVSFDLSNGNPHRFELGTPVGTIDLDKLRDEGAAYTYEGPATVLRFEPRDAGQMVTINGSSVTLTPGVYYTITSTSMTVKVYNTNPGAKNWGQARDTWKVDINIGNGVIAPLPSVVTEDTIRVKPGISAQVFFPFEENAHLSNPPTSATVVYTVKLQNELGGACTAAGSLDLGFDQATNVDGGTLMYTGDYLDAASWTGMEGSRYSVTMARIDRVYLKDGDGHIVDDLPSNTAGTSHSFFANWSQNGSSDTSMCYYASLEAVDPLWNDREEQDPDFNLFWSATGGGGYLAAGSDASGIGSVSGPGYQSADYCDVRVANQPLVRLGELGRIHSYEPLRSLRFWSASAADETGHDADLLDLFKIGDLSTACGRVNLNTLEKPVAVALFKNALSVDTDTAWTALEARRATGAVCRRIGDFFGGIAGISGSNKAHDDLEEDAVVKLAELATVRQNYFTVIVCSQVVRDVEGVLYDHDGIAATPMVKASLSKFDVELNPDGSVKRYVDSILAEQKIMAVYYRDAGNNQFRLERYDYLH